MGATKKQKLPVKVIARVKAALPAPKVEPKSAANEKKAKLVAALKRLHPMD
jgi:hypothetical protein